MVRCSQHYRMAPHRMSKQCDLRKDSKDKTNHSSGSSHKKPFDKSKWRQQQYSHKSKLQRFEENRRKAVVHKYHKELKKDFLKAKFQTETENSLPASTRSKQRKNPFLLAKEELQKKTVERALQREKFLKDTEDRKSALQRYHQEKIRKNKILSKKTKKGQPVMAGRMELLLEKVQKMVGQ